MSSHRTRGEAPVDLRRTLQAVEQPLKEILNNSTAVVSAKDAHGCFIFANRRFLEVFRKRREDVIGKSNGDLFPRELAEQYDSNDRDVLARKTAIEYAESAVLADGEHTFVSIRFPLFTGTGEVYGVCAISTDIAVRKRIEDALRNVATGVTGTTEQNVFQDLVRYLAISLDVDVAFVGELEIDNGQRSNEIVNTIAFYDCGAIVKNIRYGLAGTPCADVVGQCFRFYPDKIGELFQDDPFISELQVVGYAAIPLFDSQGKAIGVMAVMDRKPLVSLELTEAILQIFSVRAATELERMDAEEQRRRSEESYRQMFEAVEDSVLIQDAHAAEILDVNAKACQTYGYARDEMTGLTLADLSSGERSYTMKKVAELFARARNGAPVRFEWHRRNKDGSLHWDEVVLKRATIAGQDRILAFARDISQRKEREEALARSEERLRITVEAALDSIIVTDQQGSVIELNPAAERCFGYRRADVLGRPLVDLVLLEHRGAGSSGLQNCPCWGSGLELGRMLEVTARRADGTDFLAELVVKGAQGADGDIFIGYLRDISERKRAEEQHAELEAQLRQAQKMEAIGQLTGGIAHDFNNILASIVGNIVLTEERLEELGDAEVAKYLKRMGRAAQRARELIKQMLTFSRGQGGEPRSLALAPLVRESVKLLRSTLPSTIAFRLDLNKLVPNVVVDPVQAEQVLMNLCINARDAMSEGGEIRVGLGVQDRIDAVCSSCRKPVRGEFVELSVADDGPGIDPELIDRIYEPFFTTKDTGGGSGMGLAMVHGIVHEQGGHILVDTSPGVGARFRMLLRVRPESDSVAQEPTNQSLGTSPTREPLSGTVLVVDDEVLVADFMGDLLGTWGLEVVTAASGQEARALIEEDPLRFDVVVTDQTMPKMTGLELVRYLARARPRLAVILYTGYTDEVTEKRALELGAHAFLQKPVDRFLLRRQLEKLLADPSAPRRSSGKRNLG